MRMFGLSIGRYRAAIAVAMVLMVSAIAVAQGTDPKDLTGQWQGTAQAPAPAQGLRVVFLVSKADDGKWKTVFNYIDLIAQGNGIPRAADLTLQGASVGIKVPGNDGSYRGQLSGDGTAITGTWAQGGSPEMPLNLTRATKEVAWEIPKPPERPKPMAKDAKPSFDVATIKPNPEPGGGKAFGGGGRTLNTYHTSLSDLIVYAYDVQRKQVVGGPDWIDKDKFDISGLPDIDGAPDRLQVQMMFQKLLADRFGLVFHKEKRELSVYVLSVAKGGPKNLKKSDSTDDNFSVPIGNVSGGFRGCRSVTRIWWTLRGFALQGAIVDRPVLDHTGITGRYDFTLTWAQLGTEFGGDLKAPAATENPPPSLFTAMQEQLGLKLDPVKAPADVMVIDKAEKPSGN